MNQTSKSDMEYMLSYYLHKMIRSNIALLGMKEMAYMYKWWMYKHFLHHPTIGQKDKMDMEYSFLLEEENKKD